MTVTEAHVALPPVIAGPMIRHVSPTEFTLWLVTTVPLDADTRLKVWSDEAVCFDGVIDNASNSDRDANSDSGKAHRDECNCAITTHSVRVGEHCWVHLVALDGVSLPVGTRIYYDIQRKNAWLFHKNSDSVVYPNETHPSFYVPQKLNGLWHGSCRKPHHDSDDALVAAANNLERAFNDKETIDAASSLPDQPAPSRPDAFFMTGDQIYCDDVASPMLLAVHQVMAKLGLFDEQWDDAIVHSTQTLLAHPHCYNKRHELLPSDAAAQTTYEQVFKGARKPIFTSSHAFNHSITLSEIIAQYLLVWSDIPWQWVDFDQQNEVYQAALAQHYTQKDKDLAVQHVKHLEVFKRGLPKVRQLFAHLPIYMMFDDHDVTDDWNLTRGWEEAAYGNGFSKRIIGNALLAYGLCQGGGNAPKQHKPLLDALQDHASHKGLTDHDTLIDTFLAWSHWGYSLPTEPKIVVLDTRTQRWRSESNANKPSGLMDWESLSQCQQELIDQEQVVIISPAPMFGVKLIESIQKIFTFFGYPLLVDAENWMAHPGAANVLLNIFRHKKTPPEFMILSGDVHYSFVYDVRIRQKTAGAKITQVTASGLKNTFPNTLLLVFDTLNHYLYASWSPLNWFTKRRRMRIKSRSFDGSRKELLNMSGYGEVVFKASFDDADIRVLSGSQTYLFEQGDKRSDN